MKIATAPRGWGKTNFIIQYMRLNRNAVLVCHATTESDRVKRTYPDIADRVYSFHGLDRVRYTNKFNIHTEVIVDNLDVLLQGIFHGLPLQFLTVSSENVVELDNPRKK